MKSKKAIILISVVMLVAGLLAACGGGASRTSGASGWNGVVTVTGNGADFFEANSHAFAQAVLAGVKHFIGDNAFQSNKQAIENTFIADRMGKKYYEAHKYVDNNATEKGTWIESQGEYTVSVVLDLDAIESKLENMGLLRAQPVVANTNTRPTTNQTTVAVTEEPARELAETAQSRRGVPDWIDVTPQAADKYYYVGLGIGDNQPAAKDAALSDALNKLILTINATISSRTTFHSAYEETTSGSRGGTFTSSKIRMKGSANVKNVQELETYFTREGEDIQAYVLIAIPKSEVDDAIAAIDALRRELANTPTAVIAYSVDLDGSIHPNETLQSKLEEFYREQGYKVVSHFFSTSSLSGRDINGHMQQILSSNINASRIIVGTVRALQAADVPRTQFVSVTGTLSVRELDKPNNSLLDTQSFNGKGLSIKNAADAFEKMVNNLIESLFIKHMAGDVEDPDEGYGYF